jgi:hypothetical protein
MSTAPHVIYQQRLHLLLHDPATEAPSLHRRAEQALLGPAMLAAVGAALAQVLAATGLPPDAWLTLDHLALDLGNLTSEHLETQLLERLPALLRQQVATALAAAPALAAPGGAGAPAPAPAVTQAADPEAAGTAWLYFLRHGTLPPHWPASPHLSTWEAALRPLLRTPTGAFLAALRTTLAEPPARQRLVRQFSAGLLAHTLAALARPASPPARQVRQALVALLRPIGARPAASSAVGSFEAAAEDFCLAWLAHLAPAPGRPLDWPTLLATLTAAPGSPAGRMGALWAGWALLAPTPAPIPAPTPAPIPAEAGGAGLAAGSETTSTQPATGAVSTPAPDGTATFRAAPPADALATAAVFQPLLPGERAQEASLPRPAAPASGPGTGAVERGPALIPVPVAAEREKLPTAAPATRPPAGPALTPLTPLPRPGRAGQPARPLSTGAGQPVAPGANWPEPGAAAVAAAAGSGAAWPGLASSEPAAFQLSTPLPPIAAPATEYVTNAGVILLHPFLPACFADCGWVRDGQFISPQAQFEAVLMVHFLATGRGQAPEYELRLAKLLCGVAPTAPLPRRLVLGRAPRAEGRALLRAALTHWTALRNTTPTGLRAAFLQREGKLETLATGPVLTVAQAAQDVLLSRLPYGWSVGLVQLPWLPQRLSVSWA